MTDIAVLKHETPLKQQPLGDKPDDQDTMGNRSAVTTRDRILHYLAGHPEGVDDDDLAAALQLSSRQGARAFCLDLEEQGLILRRVVEGKIRSFPLDSSLAERYPAAVVKSRPRPQEHGRATPVVVSAPLLAPERPWHWEGNVQEMVLRYLERNGYAIESSADTATKEHGKDIVASRDGTLLWVTVKGFPEERSEKRTRPSTQAGHWFKHALYDAIAYRQAGNEVQVAAAFPDFPRFRSLAAKVEWVSKAGRFDYFWVKPDGSVTVTR